jgi:DNA repair exonuclease SbcCD ATPase subunit
VKGSLLAVNQVGLGLLGAHGLEHALGTSFLGLVAEDGRESCRQLLESASNGQDGSLEVELRGLTGTVRAVEVHAVAHPGAPDAAPSAMVTLRDITRARVLAQSLEAASTRHADVEQAHVAERAELAAEIERLRAGFVSPSSGDDARAAVEHQLTKALRDIENLNRRCATLESEKQQAAADSRMHETRVSELMTALADLERAHAPSVEQLMTAHAAKSSEAEAALSAATGREQDARAALERVEAAFTDERQRFAEDRQRLESEAQQAATDAQNHQTRVSELTVQLADLEREHAARIEQLMTAHAAGSSEAEIALSAATAREQDARAALERVEAAFTDERQRFADERQRLESEKQQAAADAQSHQTRVGDLTTQLADLERAHAAKVEELTTAQVALQRAEAAFTDERQRFADDRQRLESEKRQTAADAQSYQTRAGELRSQLADLERAHAAKVEALITAHAAQSAEAEAALSAAATREHESRAALQQADVAFTDERQRFADERQRLESEAAAARDAERAARAAWTTEQTERLDADRTRQRLVDAIARLAVEAGLPLGADAAVSFDVGAAAVDHGDGESTSAW